MVVGALAAPALARRVVVLLASGSSTITGGYGRTFTLRLSPRERARLLARGSSPATLTVTQGPSRVARRRVVLHRH